MFVKNKWVITQEECDKRRVKGQQVCPPEIKILGTLYWLGEGCSFRTIYNLSGRVLGRISFGNFAKKFCRLVASQLWPVYIRVPRNVAELRRVSKDFEDRGFPGACGSTDGVQIAWEGCIPELIYREGEVPHVGIQRDGGTRHENTARLFDVCREV
jgi:hypothetical protein